MRLQPQPGVDPIRGLRWILKTALRRFRLRCVDAREEAVDGGQAETAEAELAALTARVKQMFPDNPTPKQIVNVDGVLFEWDGIVWSRTDKRPTPPPNMPDLTSRQWRS